MYVVTWSVDANSDLTEIISYIAETSRPTAREKLYLLKSRAGELESFPNRGRIVPELLRQGVSIYRELIVENWRLIYEVLPEQVLVHLVVDARRDLNAVLLKRLLR